MTKQTKDASVLRGVLREIGPQLLARILMDRKMSILRLSQDTNCDAAYLLGVLEGRKRLDEKHLQKLLGHGVSE